LRTTVTEPDVKVRDYLVPLTVNERVSKYRRKQRALRDGCSHPRLRQFTFADQYADSCNPIKGKTIKMCPDRTTFDARRHRVLCFGEALIVAASPVTVSKTPDKKKDKSPCYQGMAHIVSSSLSILTYPSFVDVTIVPNYYDRKRNKRTPIGICAAPKVDPQPIKLSLEQAIDWVVVPISCTKIVGPLPQWKITKDEYEYGVPWAPNQGLACCYTKPWGLRNGCKRITGQDLKPVIAGPACMWLWPEFVDRTLDKTRDSVDDEVIEEIEKKKPNPIVYRGTVHDLVPIELMRCAEMPHKVQREGHGPDD
jgi:hypothetical protein